jgi:hypothetical protein
MAKLFLDIALIDVSTRCKSSPQAVARKQSEAFFFRQAAADPGV